MADDHKMTNSKKQLCLINNSDSDDDVVLINEEPVDQSHLDRTTKSSFERMKKQISSLEKYNEHLREQLRLINEKYLLCKQLLHNDGQAADKPTIDNQMKQKQELNRFIEEIKASAAEANNVASIDHSDYQYDSSTNTYFSQSTGYYFYPDSQTYYNINDKRYYRYDHSTKQYKILSKLEKSEHDHQQQDNEIEEGEINDQSRSPSPTSVPRQNKCHPIVIESSFKQIAPCRLIVKQSEALERGSLLMISCMGGKIGQHCNCTVTIPDRTISQVHAEINYDTIRQIYTIQDLCSRNGTYLNGKKLAQLERNSLLNGDEISLADCCKLIVHIHQNAHETCQQCQPNIIATEQQHSIYTNSMKTPKTIINNLKRKYGLNLSGLNGVDQNGHKLAAGYKDRAAERQKNIGSDCPYEKTSAGTSLDMPLTENNKGFRMLEKMGWKSGETLGSQSKPYSKAITEPIILDDTHHNHRCGLGFTS